ncbi:LacI family DNA-binding transcriptional regulator [Lapidilactobacillus luobeiensis]|uniref:LacI family DNA-binding transcriptional regulator n=1 Tax=Lapidilactobacillus luobeiensis TaxID=2950371 RepID=UPI0021C4AFF9|nr:LacI family DNA-binding transcriptional regulator [Lapidilactobacillus luobeiensis]
MVTLNDVAKSANVSKMTVSRVINHPEQVTDELKQLVFKAMNELDYHPNLAAKALAANATRIIKLVILEKVDTVEPYYATLLMGVAQFLNAHQYALQVVTQKNADIGECDGYIITGARNDDFTWIQELRKPVILYGENRHHYDFVDSDNKYGTFLSTGAAIKDGYDQIIFLGIELKESFEYSRERGYMDTMQKSGLQPQIIRFGNHSSESQQYIEDHWHEFKPNTCFVCSSDRLAIGVERGIQRMGGAIPEDFGITGFDGVFLDQIAEPKLTTVKQPVMAMGSKIAELLMQKINHGVTTNDQSPERDRTEVMFSPELIRRNTTRNYHLN